MSENLNTPPLFLEISRKNVRNKKKFAHILFQENVDSKSLFPMPKHVEFVPGQIKTMAGN